MEVEAEEMTSNKVRAGVSFDTALLVKLDHLLQHMDGLEVTRSEAVNAILSHYFTGNGSTEAVWEAVTKRRIRNRR